MTESNDAAQEALASQLSIIARSQALLRMIFLGLALQYRSLSLQSCLLEKTLVSEEPPPTPCPAPRSLQLVASLITLCALLGFRQQATELAAQQAAATGCNDQTEPILSSLVVGAAIIRLGRFLGAEQGSACEENLASENSPADEEIFTQLLEDELPL